MKHKVCLLFTFLLFFFYILRSMTGDYNFR